MNRKDIERAQNATVGIGAEAIACAGNPNVPARPAGTILQVSTAGKFGGASGEVVEVGDVITYITDVPEAGTWATYSTYVMVEQVNIEIATGAEINTGTDNAKRVTSAAVESAFVTIGKDSIKTDLLVGKTSTSAIKIGDKLRVMNNTIVDFKAVDSTAGTAGARTILVGDLLGGIIFSDPAGSGAYTLDSAANIVAGISDCVVGSTIRFSVLNNATGASAEAITITAGANGTAVDIAAGGSFVLTEATNPIGEYIIVVTNIGSGTETYDIYPLRGV